MNGPNHDSKITVVYQRISTKGQNYQGQQVDLEQYVHCYQDDLGEIQWFRDAASGKNMDKDRPDWARIIRLINQNAVKTLIVWRLDRVGRTAKGLVEFFERLQEKNIQFISLKENIDLSTPSGRMIANVIASIASFETEVRAERIRAGLDAKRNFFCPRCKKRHEPHHIINGVIYYYCIGCDCSWQGKTHGGRKEGAHYKVTNRGMKDIYKFNEEGMSITHIAKITDLSTTWVRKLLKDETNRRNGEK